VCAYICALVHVFKKFTFGALQIAEFSKRFYIVFYMHKIGGFLGASVQSDRDRDRDRKKWTGTAKGLEGEQEKEKDKIFCQWCVIVRGCVRLDMQATMHTQRLYGI
jgi:hypothetical protein